jgi:DNA-binding LytR/AlgR family response regulator
MPTALIADDEPHLALYLKDQLARLWPELEVLATARSGSEAAQQIAALEPDLAFLDIQMPGMTGLEVAQGIEGDTRVVFVTAYDEYAVQAFEQAALDYLLKPLKTARLEQTLQRCRAALAASPPAEEDGKLSQALQHLLGGKPATAAYLRHIRAGQGAIMHQVPVRDVQYFEADAKYTVVYTAGGEHVIRMPIVELAAQLDPAQFWQIHRSTLINIDHLAGTRRDDNSRLFVRMHGCERELPVARAYVYQFKAM